MIHDSKALQTGHPYNPYPRLPILTEAASGFRINSVDTKFITFCTAKPSDSRFVGLKDQKYKNGSE